MKNNDDTSDMNPSKMDATKMMLRCKEEVWSEHVQRIYIQHNSI